MSKFADILISRATAIEGALKALRNAEAELAEWCSNPLADEDTFAAHAAAGKAIKALETMP